MKVHKTMVLFLAVLLCVTGSCTRSDQETGSGPLLNSLSPSSRAVNMPGFTLTARGSGFTDSSKLFFNNMPVDTSFVNSGKLEGIIPHAMIRADVTVGEEGLPVRVGNSGGERSDDIYFDVRENNLFYSSTLVSSGAVNYYNPSIAVDEEGKMFIGAVQFDESGGEYHAALLISEDTGMEWAEPVIIYSSNDRIYNVFIHAGADGEVYASFYCGKLLFSRSGDSGETWSEPSELSQSTPSPVQSLLSSDSAGRIYVMWILPSYSSDNAVYFQRSEDSGASFTVPKNISTDSDFFDSVYSPAFAVDDSGVYTAWTAWPSGGSRYSHVYFNYSTDRGDTWSEKDRYFGVASSPSLAAAGGGKVLMALSSSYLPFSNQIILYKSENSGENWEEGLAATAESDDTYPLVKQDSVGNLNIIFQRGDEYLYTRSIDGGGNWTEPVFVTDRISSEYRKMRIGIEIDREGNLYILSEFDFLGTIYLTRSY